MICVTTFKGSFADSFLQFGSSEALFLKYFAGNHLFYFYQSDY